MNTDFSYILDPVFRISLCASNMFRKTYIDNWNNIDDSRLFLDIEYTAFLLLYTPILFLSQFWFTHCLFWMLFFSPDLRVVKYIFKKIWNRWTPYAYLEIDSAVFFRYLVHLCAFHISLEKQMLKTHLIYTIPFFSKHDVHNFCFNIHIYPSSKFSSLQHYFWIPCFFLFRFSHNLTHYNCKKIRNRWFPPFCLSGDEFNLVISRSPSFILRKTDVDNKINAFPKLFFLCRIHGICLHVSIFPQSQFSSMHRFFGI